jgi:glycosyltransferase involved in cell wall biosynthesis
MATQVTRILSVELYKVGSPNLFLQRRLDKQGYSYEVYGLGTESTLAILLKSLFVPKNLSKYAIIVTSEYFSSFGINLRLLLTRSQVKHVTIGLNQSRRLLKTKFKLANNVLDYIFRRTSLIIVHSRREAQLFEKIHNIPKDRFHFSLWGYDLPESAASQFSKWPRPYSCLIGRNNRDLRTFIRAIEGMNLDGIIITSSHEEIPENLPPNIHVFVDLPLNDTLDCIKNARVNAILLRDRDRGAGHITAVASMFSQTPQIVSDVDVIKDYFVDGVTAITVSLGDAQAVRTAIEKLMSDPRYSKWLSTNARNYAERWLTNERVTGRIIDALKSVAEGQKIPTVDPEWLEALESLRGQQMR